MSQRVFFTLETLQRSSLQGFHIQTLTHNKKFSTTSSSLSSIIRSFSRRQEIGKREKPEPHRRRWFAWRVCYLSSLSQLLMPCRFSSIFSSEKSMHFWVGNTGNRKGFPLLVPTSLLLRRMPK